MLNAWAKRQVESALPDLASLRHEKDVIDKGEITCPACLDGSCSTQGLPDPNVTGPCQLQASILCEPSAGRQRMDPMDMAAPETSFRGYVMCCQPCYDAQADEYIRVTHGRA